MKSLDAPGVSVFPLERLEEILGVEIGAPFDYERWEKGIPEAAAGIPEGGVPDRPRARTSAAPCADGGEMCPRVSVEEGKRYDVRWEGVDRFTPEKLAKVAGLYEGEETTGFSLAYDLQEKIRAFYEKEGYLQAEVDMAVGEETGGSVPLVVTVREGMEGFIRRIRFEGNRSIGEKTLLRQMTTRKRGTFHRITGSGKYDEEEWRQDLNAVIGYYQSQGYVRMKVAGVDNQWDADGGITKVVRVDEGPRFLLREIRFEGNDHFLRQELLSLMRNKEGRFVDYIGLERDQEAIAAKYRNAGFLDAEVEGEARFRAGIRQRGRPASGSGKGRGSASDPWSSAGTSLPAPPPCSGRTRSARGGSRARTSCSSSSSPCTGRACTRASGCSASRSPTRGWWTS